MTERFHALDSLRGSMMLLGIFLHVSCAYCNLPDVWWFRDTRRSIFFDAALLYIHLFRMPVFMVMAGFFGALLASRRGVAGFLRNRFTRIGVPLVLGVLTLYPVLWLLSRWGRHLGQPGALSTAWTAFTSLAWVRYMDTTHLWFLNYLLYLYLLTVVVRWLARPVADRACQLFGRLVTSRLRLVIWPFLTFLTLCTMEAGLLDTENDWIPAPRILAAYGVFFGFGWLLFPHRDRIAGWSHGAWTQVLLTLPLSLLNGWFALRQLQLRPQRDWVAFFGTAATGSVVVWLMVFGLTGLFVRYCSAPDPRWRYLADSAYWQYLMHAPVVLAGQLVVAQWPVPAFVKCAVVTLFAALVLLLTYDWLARATWVGVLLNGRRYPRVFVPRRAVLPPRHATAPSTGLDPAS